MVNKIGVSALNRFMHAHVFLLVGLMFTGCTFTHYAKRSYLQAKKEKPYDVVIVPGVPYEGEETTGVMKMRLYWAKQLYDSGFTRNIIFSGSAVYSPYVESIVMKVMVDSLGVPEDHVFSETKAEHSTENAYYSWKLAQELGFTKIALATDPFQAGMLRSFLRKYCPGMRSVPIVFDELKDLDDKKLPAIDPSVAYVEDFVSIKERESFWTRLKYTMGKRVKEEAKSEQAGQQRGVGKSAIGTQ